MDFLESRVMRGIWCALVTFATAVVVYMLTNGGHRGLKIGHGFVFAIVGALIVGAIAWAIYGLAQGTWHVNRLVAVLALVAALLIGAAWVRLKSLAIDHLGWWNAGTAAGLGAWIVVFVDLVLCAFLVYTAPDRT